MDDGVSREGRSGEEGHRVPGYFEGFVGTYCLESLPVEGHSLLWDETDGGRHACGLLVRVFVGYVYDFVLYLIILADRSLLGVRVVRRLSPRRRNFARAHRQHLRYIVSSKPHKTNTHDQYQHPITTLLGELPPIKVE